MSSNPTGSFVRSLRLSPKTDPDLTTFVVDMEERGVHVPELIRLLLREYMEKTEPRYQEPAFWKQKRHDQVVRYHKRMLQRVEGALDAVDEAAPPMAQPPQKVTPLPAPSRAKPEAPAATAPTPAIKVQPEVVAPPAAAPEPAPPAVSATAPKATTASPVAGPLPSKGTTGYGGRFLDES